MQWMKNQRRNMNKGIVVLLVASVFLAGCALVVSVQPTITPSATVTIPMPTTTPEQPTNTPEPTNTPQPTVTPTKSVFRELNAVVSVQSLNIRLGPSSIFPQVTAKLENTTLAILGKALGDEWVMIRTPDNLVGWAKAEFLDVDGSLDDVAYIQPADAMLIQGRVEDINGVAIPGVDIAIHQGTGANEIRTDAMSDAAGDFYAYLPATANGTWRVEIVGVLTTSWIMNPDMTYSGTFQTMIIDTSVPPAIALDFIYTP
jgi:hypothetical protein